MGDPRISSGASSYVAQTSGAEKSQATQAAQKGQGTKDSLSQAGLSSASLGFGQVEKVALPRPDKAELTPSDYHDVHKQVRRLENQRSLGILGVGCSIQSDQDPMTNLLHVAQQSGNILKSWKKETPPKLSKELVEQLSKGYEEGLQKLGVSNTEELQKKVADGSLVATVQKLNAKTGGGYGPRFDETNLEVNGKYPHNLQMPQVTGVFQAIGVLNNVVNTQASTVNALQSVLNEVQNLLQSTSAHLTDLQNQITEEMDKTINSGWVKGLEDTLKLVAAAGIGFMIGGPAGAAIMVCSTLVMFAVKATNLFGAGGPIDNMLADMGVPENVRRGIETGLSIGFSIAVAVVSSGGMGIAKDIGKKAVADVGEKAVADVGKKVVGDVVEGAVGDVEEAGGGKQVVEDVEDLGGEAAPQGLAGQIQEAGKLEQFSQMLTKFAKMIVKAIKTAATPVSYLWDAVKSHPDAAFALSMLCKGLVSSGAAYNMTDFIALEAGDSSKKADQLAQDVAEGVNIALGLTSGLLMIGSVSGQGGLTSMMKGRSQSMIHAVRLVTSGLKMTNSGVQAYVDIWNAVINFDVAGPMKEMQQTSTDTEILQTWFNQVQSSVKQEQANMQSVMQSVGAITRSVAPANILG